jgi:hypothetical protein
MCLSYEFFYNFLIRFNRFIYIFLQKRFRQYKFLNTLLKNLYIKIFNKTQGGAPAPLRGKTLRRSPKWR